MVDLISEPQIMQSEVILVQQTCLKKDECINAYKLENYSNNFNSFGDVKGIALTTRTIMNMCLIFPKKITKFQNSSQRNMIFFVFIAHLIPLKLSK